MQRCTWRKRGIGLGWREEGEGRGIEKKKRSERVEQKKGKTAVSTLGEGKLQERAKEEMKEKAGKR